MSKVRWPVVKPTGRLTIERGFPPDERWLIVTNIWRDTYFNFTKLIADAVSIDKATELAGKLVTTMPGHQQLARIPERLGLKGHDITKISHTFQCMGMVEGFDLDVVEESERKLVLRYLVCPWWEDFKIKWRELGTEHFAKAHCEGGCLAGLADLCNAVNPKIKMKRATWAVKGEPYCEFVFELGE